MGTLLSRYFEEANFGFRLQSKGLPTLQSNHLFALTNEVLIEHEGEAYRLRLTRNNKLILTK